MCKISILLSGFKISLELVLNFLSISFLKALLLTMIASLLFNRNLKIKFLNNFIPSEGEEFDLTIIFLFNNLQIILQIFA